jgi:multisubunit Na+/H+ antiporter MnhC subunit
VHTMRKLFALALMALALVSFAVGCGNKAEETPPAATEPPPAVMDTLGMDSTAAMSADSAGH